MALGRATGAAKPRGAGAGRAGPRSRRDRQASHGGGRKLRERGIPLLQLFREQQGVAVGLDHAAAHQEPHQPGADDLEQIRDGLPVRLAKMW